MKILVAIKQVPSRESQLRIDAAGRWIEESDLAYEINEPDASLFSTHMIECLHWIWHFQVDRMIKPTLLTFNLIVAAYSHIIFANAELINQLDRDRARTRGHSVRSTWRRLRR